MKRAALSMLLAVLAGATSGVVAQTTIEEARQQGAAMGKAMRADGSLNPSDANLAQLPGYGGTDLAEKVYFDDPDRLAADGGMKAGTSDAFATVTDKGRTRPGFSNAEILAATSRGTAIEQNPDAYLGAQSIGGSEGSCTALPPSTGSSGFYEASCNTGVKIETGQAVCRIPLVVDATPGKSRYVYTCENWSAQPPRSRNNSAARCQPAFTAAVASGVCRERSRRTVSYPICLQGSINRCSEPDVAEGDEITYECDSAAIARPHLIETTPEIVNERHDETMCGTATAGQACDITGDVCVDPDPTTRVINGVPVTRSCWERQRTYSCSRTTQASDCSDLQRNRTCRFLRTECLDDPQSGACAVSQRVYSCPLPDHNAPIDKQYVCGGDVYCLNGNCETIGREASTEFKDALVGLHSIGDAGKQFDAANLTVFSGERSTCTKKIFGASNCCSGKGIPMLTPWLCSAAEKQLDEKDDKGLCHKVGSFCSDKVLGVCVTSKDAYCCFGSKLSRILQVEGRRQIGKRWGKPKEETCKGFTIEEFQRLDLSQIDFSEVYAEFTDAAKLPDEVSVMADIQTRIQGYYDLHGR